MPLPTARRWKLRLRSVPALDASHAAATTAQGSPTRRAVRMTRVDKGPEGTLSPSIAAIHSPLGSCCTSMWWCRALGRQGEMRGQ